MATVSEDEISRVERDHLVASRVKILLRSLTHIREAEAIEPVGVLIVFLRIATEKSQLIPTGVVGYLRGQHACRRWGWPQ